MLPKGGTKIYIKRIYFKNRLFLFFFDKITWIVKHSISQIVYTWRCCSEKLLPPSTQPSTHFNSLFHTLSVWYQPILIPTRRAFCMKFTWQVTIPIFQGNLMNLMCPNLLEICQYFGKLGWMTLRISPYFLRICFCQLLKIEIPK